MLLPLVLAALLISPDQPVAPKTPGAAPVTASSVFTAATPAQLAVQYSGRIVPGELLGFQAVCDGFLVLYDDQRRFLATLSADGILGTPHETEIERLLASNGERVLALNNNGELLLLDADGNVESRRSIGFINDVDAAASDETFLVTWAESRTVYGQFLDSGERFVIAEDANLPQVASDGRRFLVTWYSRFGLYGRRITSATVMSEEVRVTDWRPVQVHDVAWDGSRYVVVYDSPDGDLRRVDVSRAGVPGVPRVIAATERAEVRPSIASSEAGTVIAWLSVMPCGEGEAVYASYDDGPAQLVSIGKPVRSMPVSAPIGNDFITAWVEQTDVTRVRARVGERVIELSSDRALTRDLVVASNGDRALVSWSACNGGIERAVAVVDANGDVAARVDLPLQDVFPAAASDGTDFVLIWTGSIGTALGDILELRALRISGSGQLLDAAPRVVATETVSRRIGITWLRPSVAWTGEEYVAVWQHGLYANELRLQRFSRTLDPIESTRNLGMGALPAVAANREAVFIAYAPESFNPQHEVRGLLLPSNPFVIAADALPLVQPEIAPWGSEFVVTAGKGVYRVALDGTVTRLTELPAAGAPDYIPRSDRAVATNGSRVLIAFQSEGDILLRTIDAARTRAVRH